MIDPKLNELPVERVGGVATTPDASPSDEQEAERLRRSRGLSINDTIAGDTMLSVGSRGVDTSGVSSGTGAGGGMTSTSTAPSSSPAPNIVGGARGVGTTPRSDAASGQSPASTAPANTPAVTGRPADLGSDAVPHHEVAARAYECWCERGCPQGSPEVDWHRAYEEVRARRQQRSRASSA